MIRIIQESNPGMMDQLHAEVHGLSDFNSIMKLNFLEQMDIIYDSIQIVSCK